MTTYIRTDPIKDVLPKDGIIGTFLEFSDGLSTCARFRFFSWCCVIGAAINNKVWVHRGDPELLPKLFPNPWVLLLAPPGRGTKTTIINMVCDLLMEACPEVRIIADKITPESLLASLSVPADIDKDSIVIGPTDATGLIKAPEASVFFGKQQYNLGLVSLITDLYDYREEWKSSTIRRGKDVLRNVCISILAGSTPTWLQTMLPQDAFTGGFMARFIIVEMPLNYLKREAFPTKPSNLTRKKLIDMLREISVIEGEFKWSNTGARKYKEIYENVEITGDPQIDSYREREFDQLLKLAMILAINEKKLILEEHHFTQALKIFNFLMRDIGERIIRLTTHPRMALVQLIEDVVKLNGRISEDELLSQMYRYLSHGTQQFYEALMILRKSKKIRLSGNLQTGVFIEYAG